MGPLGPRNILGLPESTKPQEDRATLVLGCESTTLACSRDAGGQQSQGTLTIETVMGGKKEVLRPGHILAVSPGPSHSAPLGRFQRESGDDNTTLQNRWASAYAAHTASPGDSQGQDH